MKIFFPENIKHIAIVAPSSFAPESQLTQLLEILDKQKIKVSIMKNVFKHNAETYFSSDVQSRVDDIHSAWRDRSVDLIWCLRGGYGGAALLDYIDWDLLRTRSIPFLGYSDITSLHCAMYKKGVGIPITAPVAICANEFLSDLAIDYMHKAILGVDEIVISRDNIINIQQGDCSGCAICANMTVLASLIGTEYLSDFKDKILILEDVGEEVEKLDRLLLQFKQAGILSSCKGVFFGNFKNCGNKEDLLKLFDKFKVEINGPVLSNFPFGHQVQFVPIKLGQFIKIQD